MASSVKQYENLKTLLKGQKGKKGGDLQAHLQEVFSKLILHYPDHALDKFEEVSHLIKNSGALNPAEFLNMQDERSRKTVSEDLLDHAKALRKFFDAPKVEGEEEEEAEAPELNPVGYVPNLLAESRIYQWAGIGFSEQETYLIQKSLKDLSTTSQATQLKFWGKIHGTEKDYFIAEGVLEGEDEVPEGEEEVEKPKDFEPRGTGVNKFCYWVTSNPVNVAWVKLPDITPDEIKASRVIKVSFSGDLERPIHTNPFFFGTEKIYLRSQIARISHSTTLAAKGVWKVGEPEDEGVPSREIEENVPEDAEAPVWPSTKQMADPSMWVHYQPALLKCARTTHMEEEPPEDAPEELTAEVMMAQTLAKDPYDPRLKDLTADAPIKVGEGVRQAPWIVRHMGEKADFVSAADPKKSENHGVVVARSLQWPGAFSFYAQGQVYQVYVGAGHKYEEQKFYPEFPPDVESDPEEFEDQPEPTPLASPPPEPVEGEEGQEEAEEQD